MNDRAYDALGRVIRAEGPGGEGTCGGLNGVQVLGAASVRLDDVTITGSHVALSAGAGGEAWVSNSRIYLYNLGVQPAGGKIHSLCDNQVAGNTTEPRSCSPRQAACSAR